MPAWRLHLTDHILHVDLTDGIATGDFERLYDGILQELRAVDRVVIEIGDLELTKTRAVILDSLVDQIRSRDVAVDVVRIPESN